MRLSDWTYERFRRATGLPEQAYREWLELPGDGDRQDALELLASPAELALIRAMLDGGVEPMFG